MAEARSAVSEPRVGRIEEGRSPKNDFYLGIRSYVIRRFFRTRNQIKNGIWPTNLWNLAVLVLVLSVLLIMDWEFAKPVTSRLRFIEQYLFFAKDWPLLVRSLLDSITAGFIFFIILLYVRRYMLRILLSYRGWMYEQPKTQSASTKMWGLLVKLVSGRHPTLYACQQSLPKLPVPSLKRTLKELIHSLKPLYGEDSAIIQELKAESKEFQKTLGPKLQRILYLKSWWAQNYVTDFWEKYIYLMGRSPLPINSNYYIMDQSFGCPSTNQVARAANVMYHILVTSQKLDREQIEPLLIRNTIPICMAQYDRAFSTTRENMEKIQENSDTPKLDREQIGPLLIKNTIPICMAQYDRAFSTTRIPGEEIDELVHYTPKESKHVCVYRKGIYYKLEVYDKNRKLVTPASLQKQLAWIMQDADKHQVIYYGIYYKLEVYNKNRKLVTPASLQKQLAWIMQDADKHQVYRKGIYYKLDVYDKNRKLVIPASLQKQLAWIMQDADKHQDSYSDTEKSIPALTGLDRTQWARVRKQHFSEGLNAESLATIEKALFHVVLGTQANKDFSSRAGYLLHADGKSIWFDKSFSLMVSADGRMGFNCEHSFADAPVMAHIIEHNLTYEVLGHWYDKYSNCVTTPDDQCEELLFQPARIQWDVPSSISACINRAVSIMQQAIDDIDLNVAGYFKYGKGFVKTCKVSPDAYIQMALQITYFKNAGKHCLTYESSMTRLYLAGRTETVRSLTLEAAAFVKAFLDKSVSREEKIRLMHKACEKHARQYKDCMNGLGIDRHLFALYVVSKGLDYDCEFLKKCLSIPWTLSTSQSPQQQLASSPSCDIQEYRDMVSPGGGFGPVSDDGYGVAYMIPGDFKFFFHVSSKRSSKCTDSTLFMNQLFETFDELKELFEGNKTE